MAIGQWKLFCLVTSTQLPWPPPGKPSTELLDMLIDYMLACHLLLQSTRPTHSTLSVDDRRSLLRAVQARLPTR